MYSWWTEASALMQLDGININEEIRGKSPRPESHQTKKFLCRLSWLLPWKCEKGLVCMAGRRWRLSMHHPRRCIWTCKRRQGNRRSHLPSPSLLLPPLTYTLTFLKHWQLSAKKTYNILIKTNTNVFHIHRPIIKYYHVLCDFAISLFPWGLNFTCYFFNTDRTFWQLQGFAVLILTSYNNQLDAQMYHWK